MGQISGFNWENMRIVLAVARAGSARQAAAGLGMHSTSITRKIAAFEQHLGTRVFHKSVNGYSLTQSGQSILRHAEIMESEAFAIERQLTGAEERIAGQLRVTMSTTIAAYLLVDTLRDFTRMYPDIELMIDTGYNFADFNRREADVAIRVSNDPGDHLVGRKFGPYYQSIYATSDYIRAHPPGEKNSGCRRLGWQSRQSFQRRRARMEFPHIKNYLQIKDELLLIEAVKAGTGIATIPCFQADMMPELVRVSQRPPIPVFDVWLLTHEDSTRSGKVRCFVEFFTAALLAKADLLSGTLNSEHITRQKSP